MIFDFNGVLGVFSQLMHFRKEFEEEAELKSCQVDKITSP